MNDRPLRSRFTGQAILAMLILAVVLMRILPLAPGRIHWPGADLALCLCLAWVLRRPEQVFAGVIAVLFLFEDLLLMRPLGLWPLFVLAASEALRLRAFRWRDQAFVFEWLRVALLMGLMMIGYRLIMILFLLPVPGLGATTLQWLASVIAYPIVVLAARWLAGLRRLSAVEIERLG